MNSWDYVVSVKTHLILVQIKATQCQNCNQSSSNNEVVVMVVNNGFKYEQPGLIIFIILMVRHWKG